MRVIQYIGVLLFFFLVSCEKNDVEPQKTRTLMVYLAGDNNLSGHMQKNISSMMSAWKESYNANIVIYFDAPNAAPELYTFRFKGKEVEKQVLKTYEEMDSADPEVLKKILNEMQDLYPSDSYGLILGSHASGWIPSGASGRSNRMLHAEPVLTRSFGKDYTGSNEMDTRDMAKAIPFNKENLEFILFDACLMSSIEVLYAFVVCTSESILSFMYIFPLTSMLVLFKDRTYMVQCGIGTLVISIASSVHKFMNGMNSASNVNDYTLQASCIILCYICYVVSIDHLNESDGALTNSIKADLERVVRTVEQVKGAGNQIMDGVTVVRELEDENRQSSTTVVQGMSELTQNNNVLHDKTMSSMDMTTNINEQVERMASLMEQMVTLMNESADHANESSGELSRVAETTMLMAKLSDEVETILSEFQKEFERVKTEVSTIESINSQTNLLALNASIEAARAGDAGKGFAVVADEIRNLSTETQESSSRIMAALANLGTTSVKMTDSIGQTVNLIQETSEKVAAVNESVSGIAKDAAELEQHLSVIDSAMQDVKESNHQMVSNMEGICNVMDAMTDSIGSADGATKTMLNKYDESSRNVNKIETVVQDMMEKLGVGGFMGIQDVKPQMHCVLVRKGETREEYHGKVVRQSGSELWLQMDRGALGSIREKTPYDIQIVVDNVLYNWTDVLANVENEQGRDVCHLVVKTTPVIANRRKYPRMPIANSCTITRKDTDKTYRGKMVNVSANGFAFAAASDDFAELKGTQLVLDIPDFPVKEERTMEGVVIRSTDNHGEYIVGCRMPEDSPAIQKYVNDNYKE